MKSTAGLMPQQGRGDGSNGRAVAKQLTPVIRDSGRFESSKRMGASLGGGE